eukprot:scaffold68483_cov24-Prasinocladus_malaysianus.AAC.1
MSGYCNKQCNVTQTEGCPDGMITCLSCIIIMRRKSIIRCQTAAWSQHHIVFISATTYSLPAITSGVNV